MAAVSTERGASPESASYGRRFDGLIVVTGGCVLSLELLASRVLTPYFGVSLYIWAGILSITLTFLAVGYAWGGRVASRETRDVVTYRFLLSPALSAAAIVAACAVYPVLFPLLPHVGMIPGSFAANVLLLAPSLVLLAAMNPLLISMQRDSSGNAGKSAGRVLFLSTLGSVGGVLVTAFVFIPLLTNFRSLLLLALLLCASAALIGMSVDTIPSLHKRRLVWVLTPIAAVAIALLVGRDSYLELATKGSDLPFEARVEAEYTSLFGNVKVVQFESKLSPIWSMRAYLQDGLVQNRATTDGAVSLSPYTYMLEILTDAYAPEAKRILVLGLGAGIVPGNLARPGASVTVVDINRDALAAATDFFGFDPTGIDLRWEDARTFVRKCTAEFDAVVMDLFQGDHAPDHLFSVEFFRDVRDCLRFDGSLIMNTIFDDRSEIPNQHLLATVASVFDSLLKYELPDANTFLVASRVERRIVTRGSYGAIPLPLREGIRIAMRGGHSVDRSEIVGAAPITDERNIFSVVYADSQLRHRRRLAKSFPARVLLN